MNQQQLIEDTIRAMEKRMNQLFTLMQAQPTTTEFDLLLFQYIDRLPKLLDALIDMEDD